MTRAAHTNCYWIYMLECEDGSYYTGYTNNLVRRFRLHVEGKAGVRYTRSHPPVRIAQCWRLFDTVGTALKVELLVKRQGRPGKNRLVEDPARLKKLVTGKFDRDVRIYTADPSAVESESMAMTPEDLRNGHNPFADAPASDV